MTKYKISDTIDLILSHPLHAKELYSTIKKNKKHLGQYTNWTNMFESVNEVENHLIHNANRQDDGTELTYHIYSEKKIIGCVSLHQINTDNNSAAIGYWIAKNMQGNGIVTKATEILIQNAFSKLNINRIEILTSSLNAKSITIPTRLGFTKEGTLRQAEKHKGQYMDIYIYSLLKSEWIDLSTKKNRTTLKNL